MDEEKVTKLEEPEEIVKVTWFFKGDAPKEEIEEFFKEYEDEKYIVMKDIFLATVTETNEDVWVIQFSTLRSTFNSFMEDFGKLTTIREGW